MTADEYAVKHRALLKTLEATRKAFDEHRAARRELLDLDLVYGREHPIYGTMTVTPEMIEASKGGPESFMTPEDGYPQIVTGDKDAP